MNGHSHSTVIDRKQHIDIIEDTITENNQTENMDTNDSQQLPLLDRELTEDEVKVCEHACISYVKNDEFEIELQNLNEVNEYFRIFKDQILQLKNEVKNLKEDQKNSVDT